MNLAEILSMDSLSWSLYLFHGSSTSVESSLPFQIPTHSIQRVSTLLAFTFVIKTYQLN